MTSYCPGCGQNFEGRCCRTCVPEAPPLLGSESEAIEAPTVPEQALVPQHAEPTSDAVRKERDELKAECVRLRQLLDRVSIVLEEVR